MNISQAVIKRIYELCNQRGITINALCNLSGVTQSTVNAFIIGATQYAGIGTIQKLCDGLNITIREFFDSDIFDSLDPELK